MNKLKLFFTDHPAGKILLSVFFSFLLTVLTFNASNLVYGTGIDNPLPWVFNYFINGHIVLGKDLIFPHGPLAFLMYPLPMGHNLAIGIFFYFFFRFIFSVCVFHLFNPKSKWDWLLPALIVFIILELVGILLILIGLTSILYLIHFKTGNKKWIFPALILCAFSIYIKSYIGAISSLITFSFIIIHFYKNRNIKDSISFIITWSLALIMIWLLLYKSFSGLPRFLYGQYQLIQDNSSAVAYYPDNNWRLLSLSFIILLLIPFIQRDRWVKLFYCLFILSLFAAWKHGMAREDIYHVKGFCFFLILFFSLLILFADKRKILIFISGTVIIYCVYTNAANSFNYEEMEFNPVQLHLFKEFVRDYEKISKQSNDSSLESVSIHVLDTNIIKKIGNNTVDVYPWDYSFISANHLNWQPRPVIHSYASYTSWLDQQNADHFRSDKAPSFLIWELNKVSHDANKGNLESIDDRYLLNDEPKTIIALLDRYRLEQKDQKLLLFKKTNEHFLEEEKKTRTVKAEWNEWITVPEENDGIVRAELSFNENLMGLLKSFFYKDEAFTISYQLENEEIVTHRIVPKNAMDGIWINPFIRNPENNLTEPLVKKIKFNCTNPVIIKNKLTIDWQLITVNSTVFAAGKDSSSRSYKNAFMLFGKTKSPGDAVVFQSLNKFDREIPYWYNSTDHLIKDDFVSAPSSFQMPADSYSPTFIMDFDSLARKNENADLTISSGAWIKTSGDSKASYVISIEKENKSLSYFASPVQDHIVTKNKWTYMNISKKITEKIPLNENVKMKVYIWNTGKKNILIDDMKVSAGN